MHNKNYITNYEYDEIMKLEVMPGIYYMWESVLVKVLRMNG
jgi:hypothetical protein